MSSSPATRHRTTSSTSSTSSDCHVCDALKLEPQYPIERAKLIKRRVRARNGDVHHRSVLVTLDSSSHPRAYSLKGIIFEQNKKGVTIYHATPVKPATSKNGEELWVSAGPSVVIKCVPQRKNAPRMPVVDDVISEIAALQQLTPSPSYHHPNVIHLLDCMKDENSFYLVLPYLAGGDLFSYLDSKNGKGLPEEEAKRYFRQMVAGLLFMKETMGLAHHDISLENFIRNDGTNEEEGEIEVIDLGMCLRVPTIIEEEGDGHRLPVFLHAESCKGKPNYLSPERVTETEFDPFASDIWSLGVCLYTLLTGRPLYSSPDDHAFRALARGGVRKVVALYEGYGLVLPPMAKDLVCLMLHADSMSRPTLEDILHHPFLLDEGAEGECKGSHPCEDSLCGSGSSSSSSSSSGSGSGSSSDSGSGSSSSNNDSGITKVGGKKLCKSHADRERREDVKGLTPTHSTTCT